MTTLNTLLGIGASGMLSQQSNLDIIADNMANANSVGYKKVRAVFSDVVFERVNATGGEALLPVGGVQIAATQTLLGPGKPLQGSSPLDLTIQGDGYFQVRLPDGSLGYTRDGTFSLDADGRLVNSSGLELEPGLQFDVAANDIQIGPDGRVTVYREGEIAEVGQITLARFAEPANLEAIGDGVFRETPASGAPVLGGPGSANMGSLAVRSYESSNVDLAEEMLNLITAQRAYQLSSRAVQVADEMMQAANNLRG
jgi:flagellar basal-body rod protein FlgG